MKKRIVKKPKTDTSIIAEAVAEAVGEVLPGASIEVVAPDDPFGDEGVDRLRVTRSSSYAPMVTTYVTLSQLTEAFRRAGFGVLAEMTGGQICRHYWISEVFTAENPALPATQLVGLKLACPECFPLKPEGGSFARAHITRRK